MECCSIRSSCLAERIPIVFPVLTCAMAVYVILVEITPPHLSLANETWIGDIPLHSISSQEESNASLLCALRGKYRLNRKPIASMRRRKRSPRVLFRSRRCYNRQEVAGGIIQQCQGSHSTQGCWVNEQSCNSSRDRNLVSEDLVCPLTSTFELGTPVKVRIISVNPEKSDATAAPDVRRPVFTSTLPTSALSIGTNVGGAVTIRATIYWPETLP